MTAPTTALKDIEYVVVNLAVIHRTTLVWKMDLDGMTLLVRSGVGARDTGATKAPSSNRRRANNMGALNSHLRSLLLEAAGQAQVSEMEST